MKTHLLPKFGITRLTQLSLLLVTLHAGSIQLAGATTADLLLINVNLVDVELGEVQAAMAVVIDEGRIESVLPAAQAKRIDASEVVDLQQRYLVPGLWDMHVHFEGRELVADNALLLPVYLAYGITTVREAASNLAPEVLKWRDEIARGQRLGPRIFTAGQKFEGIDSIWDGDLEVGDRAGMLAGMDKLAAMKVDFIKITENTMAPQLFLETVAEAHRRGYRVSSHVPYGTSIQELAEAGLSSVEHAGYVMRLGFADEAALAKAVRTGELSKEQAAEHYQQGFDQQQATQGYRMLAREQVAVTPTLIGLRQLAWLADTDHSQDAFARYLTKAFSDNYQWRIDRMADDTGEQRAQRKRRFEQEASQLPYLQQAGVMILAGSDSAALNTYVYPALALHEELQLFQQSGLSPAQILRTATLNGARFMGQEQDFGSIKAGKFADLVVLGSNPLEDISATQDIEGLVYRGQWRSREALDKLLEDAAASKRDLDAGRQQPASNTSPGLAGGGSGER